jgi:catechol 2,3-dioxygenase-like lactoylglutathione lyase family enzyme
VSLDCADHRRLGEFWAQLLGGEIVLRTEGLTVVRLGDLLLTAVRVDDYVPPSWPDGAPPKQLHLEVDVEDLAAAARRALDLGAVRAEVQPEPAGHLVFFDPAGHPFCLTTEIAEWRRSTLGG